MLPLLPQAVLPIAAWTGQSERKFASADRANVTLLIPKMILSYNLICVQYVPAPPRRGRLA